MNHGRSSGIRLPGKAGLGYHTGFVNHGFAYGSGLRSLLKVSRGLRRGGWGIQGL